MSVRPILRFPDPCLRLPAEPVTRFDDALRSLASDLLETMRAAQGIGITAPHLGIRQRVVMLDRIGSAEPRCYVNPEIVWLDSAVIRAEEGSVSMPGVSEQVERPARIRITYRDLEGNPCSEEAADFRAVCLQHEIDQLDGMFWIYRLSRLKRDRLVKRYQKLQHGG